MDYYQCHLEFIDGQWRICWLDGRIAYDLGFNTKVLAKRTLDWLRVGYYDEAIIGKGQG